MLEEDDWLDAYNDSSDLVLVDHALSRIQVSHSGNRVGWPAIQAEVLREIVDLSDITDGACTISLSNNFTRLSKHYHIHHSSLA